MATIRANPENLMKNSFSIKGIASEISKAAKAVQNAANSAPSYNGQFGPKVKAIGGSAYSSGCSKSEKTNSDGSDLQRRAEKFKIADTGSGFSQWEILLAQFAGWRPGIIAGINDWVRASAGITDYSLLSSEAYLLGSLKQKSDRSQNILNILYEKITKYKDAYEKIKGIIKDPKKAFKDFLKGKDFNKWIAEATKDKGGIWQTINQLQKKYYEPGKKIFNAGKDLVMGSVFLSRLAGKTIKYTKIINGKAVKVVYDTITIKGNDWISKGMKKLLGLKDATKHITGTTLLASAWVEGMAESVIDAVKQAKKSFTEEIGSHSRKVSAGTTDGSFRFLMEGTVVTAATFGTAALVGAATGVAMTAAAPVIAAVGALVVAHKVIGQDLGVYDKVTEWWKTTKLRESIVSGGEKIIDTAKDLYNGAKDWLKDKKEKVDNALENGKNAVKSFFGGLKKAFA